MAVAQAGARIRVVAIAGLALFTVLMIWVGTDNAPLWKSLGTFAAVFSAWFLIDYLRSPEPAPVVGADEALRHPGASSKSHLIPPPAPAAAADGEELAAMRIAEVARKRFLTWLSWTFGAVGVFVTVLGLKGYSDWNALLDSHKKELDAKVQKQVEENLKANYQTRTEQVIQSVIDARVEFKNSATAVANLQTQAKSLEAEIVQFREKLTKLEAEARQQVAKLNEATADFAGSAGPVSGKLREQQFVNKSREYAKKLKLTLPEPKLVFRNDPAPGGGLRTIYDIDANEYVVNSAHLDEPGLAEYVALMGRFFEKNQTVVGSVGMTGFPDLDLWQDFRYSVVNYLLVTDKLQPEPAGPDDRRAFFRTLTAMEKKSDAAAVRKLAVALLESFGADWNSANFRQKVHTVNDRVSAVPPDVVREALAGWN